MFTCIPSVCTSNLWAGFCLIGYTIFCFPTESVPPPWDRTFSWWHPLAVTAGRERCRHTGTKTAHSDLIHCFKSIGFDVSGCQSTFRSILGSVKGLKAALKQHDPGDIVLDLLEHKAAFCVKSSVSAWCSPAKQLHGMWKAVETTLHKYGLVALAVNNPQLAVRLRCRSKDRGRGSEKGCVSDTGSQVETRS